MTELQCPVEQCEYSTDTNRGLSIHASQTHPDLEYDFTNKKTYSCAFCDAEFEDYPSRRESKDSDNYFCSVECKDSYEAKDGLDTTCAQCGDAVHVPPSHIDEVGGYEQKNYFCDKQCESSFKSTEWVGEGHPCWQGGKVTAICEECGDEYSVKPSKTGNSRFCSVTCKREDWKVDEEVYTCVNCGNEHKRMSHNVENGNSTCSRECLKEHLSEIKKGESNPQWLGGRFDYYGPNWNSQREKTLERDEYCCQECDMNRDKHMQIYNQDLHVHHKVPRRDIVDVDSPTIEQFELANSLDNLVALCKSCHRKRESSGTEV